MCGLVDEEALREREGDIFFVVVGVEVWVGVWCGSAMMSYGGPAMCCARDGGAGVLMSLQSAVSLWEQPFGRGGMQGARGSSFGGGLQSRYLDDALL